MGNFLMARAAPELVRIIPRERGNFLLESTGWKFPDPSVSFLGGKAACSSRNGNFQNWLIPEIVNSKIGDFQKWLLPEMVISRNCYFQKCLSPELVISRNGNFQKWLFPQLAISRNCNFQKRWFPELVDSRNGNFQKWSFISWGSGQQQGKHISPGNTYIYI